MSRSFRFDWLVNPDMAIYTVVIARHTYRGHGQWPYPAGRRSRHVYETPDDLFAFQRAIDVVEPNGPDTMLVFTLGDIEAIARVHPEDRALAGTSFPFEVDMAKAKVFDVESGNRI